MMQTFVKSAAEALRDAELHRHPCAPIRELLGVTAVESDAYAVQSINTEESLLRGRRLVGRKIGLTARSVQQQLGVSQPDYGMLFADMWVPDDHEVSFQSLIQPKAEAELAFVLDRDVRSEKPSFSDVVRAIGYVVPAIEIVDSRIADWNIGLLDTIADNASSGLFVLGGPARRLDGLDLQDCQMELWVTRPGASAAIVESRGQGRNCLGSPLNAAVWLADRMAGLGRPLAAGDVIMTGALGPMVTVARGDRIEARIAGFGTARTAFD